MSDDDYDPTGGVAAERRALGLPTKVYFLHDGRFGAVLRGPYLTVQEASKEKALHGGKLRLARYTFYSSVPYVPPQR